MKLMPETLSKKRDPSGGVAMMAMDRIKHTDVKLHESTSPEAIRKLHRREVAAFLRRCRGVRPEVEVISDACDLPYWNVERALATIDGKADPLKIPAEIRVKAGDRIAAYLKKHGEAKATEIAAALGMMPQSVRWNMMNDHDRFRCRSTQNVKCNGMVFIWSLR